MYRYHTLPGARAKAARMGWRGAMYAWESTDTGEETTPEQIMGPDGNDGPGALRHAGTAHQRGCRLRGLALLAGHRRRRVPARRRGRDHFWRRRGSGPAAPCWKPTATAISAASSGRTSTTKTIDDNAYTNIMARWNIRRGLDIAALMAERWPARWADLAGQAWARRCGTPSVASRSRRRWSRASIRGPGCSSSSPASSSWRRSISPPTPAAPSRWTWCSGGSGRSVPRS